MNWKEFLKPTKNKVIIFVAISIISLLVLFPFYYTSRMGWGPCPVKGMSDCPALTRSISFVNIALIIIISYLIASAILNFNSIKIMEWKLFFKPTIAKIIVAVLILLIFVPFIHYDTGIRCITTPCPAAANGSIGMWLIFSRNFYIYYISFVTLIIGIILSYLVSCVVIFRINKTRKK